VHRNENQSVKKQIYEIISSVHETWHHHQIFNCILVETVQTQIGYER